MKAFCAAEALAEHQQELLQLREVFNQARETLHHGKLGVAVVLWDVMTWCCPAAVLNEKPIDMCAQSGRPNHVRSGTRELGQETVRKGVTADFDATYCFRV